MTSTYTPQGTTTRLTPADEAASAKEAIDNMAQEAFHDWPNEAGFDGLTEHRGPIELPVRGAIPVWAAGSLYRTGPGQCKVDDTKSGTFHTSHWFDGLAHTHRFDMVPTPCGEGANGSTVRVHYSSRRQSDKAAADIKAEGAMRSMSFAQRTDPCVGLFGKFMSVFTKRPDFYNVGVTVGANLPSFPHQLPKTRSSGHRTPAPSNILLGTDASVLCALDPLTLEPLSFPKQSTLHPSLTGPLSGAHGLSDPVTGSYTNYNLSLGKNPLYRIFTTSGTETKILATILAPPAYIHSFFMTPSSVILCVPVAHYALNGLKMLWAGNMRDAWTPFDPSEPTRWYVVDRLHGRGVVAEFASEGGFFFHVVNAWEEEGTGDVVCEVVDYGSRYIVDAYYYEEGEGKGGKAGEFWNEGMRREKCFPRLRRYRLKRGEFTDGGGEGANRKRGKGKRELPVAEVIMEIPSPHVGDMPALNPRYQGKKHRYAYFLISRVLSTMFDGIAKVDTETRESLRWEGRKGHTPGEAIFVPRPGTDGEVVEEDDGVLLSVVLDGENRTSYLLCLDARTMTELGSAECEFAVAIGLHGRHVPLREDTVG
ncbi:beta,beta-carotene 9',10'-dioxygenase [Schizothecium vesticola]|uniref:Beta,beta-carotene 9',10'-dioxygenase n=1 Tax=Schizothecium vesticola TaxID=314040 RepID=A0AA40F9F0_9PEZI|nr:beta,beta-carotene 9',10'-dioxygenase [Schizothecium vesticola]